MSRARRLISLAFALPMLGVCTLAFAGEGSAPIGGLTGLSLEELLTLKVRGTALYEGRRIDAPGSITVISRDMLKSMRAKSIVDVLNVFVPGVDALPYRSEHGTIALQIASRGIVGSHSQQVLILWNGFVELNDLMHGAPAIPSELDLRLIERIEISRSPSPTHGGSAITVINVVTRDQTLEGGEVAFDLGAHQHGSLSSGPAFLRASGVAGQRFGEWHLSASLSITQDSGEGYAVPMGSGDELSMISANDATNGSLQLSISARNQVDRVVLRAFILRHATSAWFTGLAANVPGGMSGVGTLRAGGELSLRPNDLVTIRAGGSFGHVRAARDLDGGAFASLLREAQGSLAVISGFDLELAGSHAIEAGLEYELHALTDHHFETWDGAEFVRLDSGSVTRAGAAFQHVVGGWIADTWTIRPNLVLSGAVRADEYVGFGTRKDFALSPRAALGYQPIEELTLKLVYASSLRPPTVYERLGVDAFPLLGDPNVGPEAVHSLELASEFVRGDSTVELTPFVQQHFGRLDYASRDGGPALVAANEGTTRSMGIELQAAHELSGGSRVFAHLAYVVSADLETGRATPNWPRLLAAGGLTLRGFGFDFTNTVYLRALRAPPAGLEDLEQHAPIHVRWDSTLGYRIDDVIELSVQAQNITDEDNVVLTPNRDLSLPQRGRSFSIGLQLLLGGSE